MDFLASLCKWTPLERNCYPDGLLSKFANTTNRNASKTCQAERKPLMTTKPKRNAEFWAQSKGLCIFMKSQNLWDFALDKKIKAKPKALASCLDGNEKFPHLRTTLRAQALWLKKIKYVLKK